MIPLPLAAIADSAVTRWAVAGLVVAALCLGSYLKGAEGVRAEWQAEKDRQAATVAKVEARQAEASVQVVTKYVDRVQVVRQKGETIVQEVPVYVPSDACALPGGFRLLHDAAARGERAEPAARLDAAPVAAQDLARTVAENYTACRLNAEQLSALQTWVREVHEAAQ